MKIKLLTPITHYFTLRVDRDLVVSFLLRALPRFFVCVGAGLMTSLLGFSPRFFDLSLPRSRLRFLSACVLELLLLLAPLDFFEACPLLELLVVFFEDAAGAFLAAPFVLRRLWRLPALRWLERLPVRPTAAALREVDFEAGLTALLLLAGFGFGGRAAPDCAVGCFFWRCFFLSGARLLWVFDSILSLGALCSLCSLLPFLACLL